MVLTNHRLLFIVGISGALAVTLGALGAHALQEVLSETQLRSFETGVRYHIYHTLALFALAVSGNLFTSKARSAIGLFFLIGIVLFSGSIYLLSMRSVWGLDGLRVLGPVTPVGGILLIIGWVRLAWEGLRRSSSTVD